jgi:signal transduction histidine kinase
MDAIPQSRKEIVHELHGHVTGRSIKCVVGDLPHVYGDRILLRQAFVHLLDNAVKYTAENPQARIEVGCGGRRRQRGHGIHT